MKYRPRPLPHKRPGRKPAPVRRIPRCIPVTEENYQRLKELGAGTVADGIETLMQESTIASDPTRIVLPGE